MAGEVSTIQSLKAVDAWIDVINANINGGVRTAFKASRLKFSGSNVDVSRTGNATSLPLQFPEPGLTTANTVIDFSQGAITASTENTHLAVQGDGWFTVCNAIAHNGDGSCSTVAGSQVWLTRDGEFRTDQNGLLVNSSGQFLCITFNGGGNNWFVARLVYNDVDGPATSATMPAAVRLSDYLTGSVGGGTTFAGGGVNATPAAQWNVLARVTGGRDQLRYTSYGSTIFDMGWSGGLPQSTVQLTRSTSGDNTILSKSLEASNASMTQSVPELSLAQKLFSALTKVLQTKQTNVDGVLNLVR
jgi:flagellar hook protein FlgE